MNRRFLLVSVAGLMLAACTSVPTGGPGVTAGPANAPTAIAPSVTPSAAAPPEAIDMCALVSLADVQGRSPFKTPLATVESSADKGTCVYQAAIGAEDPVSVLLAATTFGSAADAQTSQANHRQSAADNGTVTDIAGLGDTAFGAGFDIVGVHAVVGAHKIDANFKGEFPDTTDAAKVAAGTELVRLVIDRLP